MASLLKIDVSPRGGHSYSRQLGQTFVEGWQAAHAGGTVVERDLAKNQPTFVDLPWIAGAFTPPVEHTDEHKAALKQSDEIIAEIKAADHILITTPLYNFQVPAVLKAWIDHAVRKDLTFDYTEKGPVGLLKGKKVTVISASGGLYVQGEPSGAYDYLTPYIKFIFGFIGITDVTVLSAGGASNIRYGKISEEDWKKPFEAQALELAKA
ncbi:FMN-dependent NADH-azoreductase [Terriglobus sp. RCC_193]|uniref:FMN-dependent NADH-azoreductase n=1 Tax=Terriglobus sp. RCC_193 TaxID=3239218 RepID=UPI0035267F69